MKRRDENNGGFTLLEVMASLAILSIGVVAVLQLFSGGLRLARAGENRADEVMLAREIMSEALLDEDMKEDVKNGKTEHGLEWRVEITPYEKTDENTAVRVFKLIVNVSNPNMRNSEFTLTTLKAVFGDKRGF